MSDFRPVTVRVLAFNDDGVPRTEYGEGTDTSEAVADAIATLIRDTEDDTWTMSEWWAA